MRRVYKLLFVVFLLNSISCIGQGSDSNFEKTIEYDNYREVFFTLDHRATEEEYKAIYNEFYGKKGVVDFVMTDGFYCKMSIKYDVGYDEVSQVISQFGFSIQKEPIKVEDDNSQKEQNLFPHMPVKQDLGSEEKNQLEYDKNFQLWMKEYPAEYKLYLDYLSKISK